jgi:hypothetical protein
MLRTWTDDTTTGTRQFTWSEEEIWRGRTLLASDSRTGHKRYHLDHLVAFVASELEAPAVEGAAGAEGVEGLFADADAGSVSDEAGGAEQ